jgi:hypothetical protein
MKKIFSKIGLLTVLYLAVFSFGFGVASAYNYIGYKWSGISTNYYINNIFASSFLTAMQAADAAWDNAGSKFRFYYNGTTSRNPNVYAFNYSKDGYNDIGHYNYGNTGQIANIAQTGIFNNSGIISEVDTTFNI